MDSYDDDYSIASLFVNDDDDQVLSDEVVSQNDNLVSKNIDALVADSDDDDVAVERFDVVAEVHADACDSDDDDDDDDIIVDNVIDILFKEDLDGMIFVEILGDEVNNSQLVGIDDLMSDDKIHGSQWYSINVREILAKSNDKNEPTEQIGYNVLEVLNKQEISEVKCGSDDDYLESENNKVVEHTQINN
ncbi:coiled-coil domain-containing protein 1-like [Schistocerca gregaria]|uniref:coiled-coil domain-containing protein 1-like n=1 Tax=Schistocerca gregaria TaxID=7010 RepID=UPI00211EFA6E|nr:coiled-coil domain-containing protein 1-like [Schistocerca gregaria]